MLLDDNGQQISWSYFKQLVELQETEGLHAGNKLTERHINFWREIMKVRLAVQVFSASVADALDFCNNDLHLPKFSGADATAKFCRVLNDVFDALNTRNVLSKNTWGKPMNIENEMQLNSFFQNSVDYISAIKTHAGENILNTRRKTGFKGLIISIRSLQNMFEDLVKGTLRCFFRLFDQGTVSIIIRLLNNLRAHINDC